MLNLIGRSTVYAVYSAVVWGVVLFVSDGALSEPGGMRTLACVAVACVLGAVSSFAVLAFCRRRRMVGLPEYFGAAIGRTGVPCCLVLVFLITMDEETARVATYRVLAAYFLTAPIHVWLTIPSESEFQKRYAELDEKD